MSADNSAASDREYRALRTGCGAVELANWSSISVTGADRQTFLNNFCTNDVKRLATGECCESFFCNVKGKIIGHGIVTCRTDELVIIGSPTQGALLAEHLNRYVIREDVEVRDESGEKWYVLLAGDRPLREQIAAWRSSTADPSMFGRSMTIVTARIPMLPLVPLLLIGWRLVGSEFECLVELCIPDAEQLIHLLFENGFVTCDDRTFTTARVEAGTPLYGVDFDEHNFPQEVGRDRHAISFTKGCYLGQETVARIDAMGHVNQRIVGVAFSGDKVPPPGTELTHNGAKVGRVTSATLSPALNRPLALAMVRREANSVGTQLESPVGPAEVVALSISGSAGN